MSNSQWQFNPPVGQPGALTTGGGGMTTGARDTLDAKRMGQYPDTPSAAYPDGYLGTINSRREDRVLNAVKTKINDRSYQRGVHKFERVDAKDYYWPREFNMSTGLEYQARGKRWTAKGSDVERLAHGGKYAFTSPVELGRIAQRYGMQASDPAGRAETDPKFREKMKNYLPDWK